MLKQLFRRSNLAPLRSPRGGASKVGWLMAKDTASIVYFEPERVRSAERNRDHAKSASRCPAILNIESRYFVIRCPFDLHLRFTRSENGTPGVRNMLGEKSPLRPKKLKELIHMTARSEWRHPERPMLQLMLPYIFVSDDPVWISQTDAFLEYTPTPMPGLTFGGRFPIHIWPRQLMWAFEWHEPQKDLILKRGQPWFYLGFETEPSERPVQMLEAERTPELERYIDQISGTVNYVNQTFSLFRQAERRRPEKLLTPLKGRQG